MNESALPDALNHFADALAQSTQASSDLSSAVLASEATRKKRNRLVALATGAILIMIVLNLILAIAALSTQAAIKDCTDPSGKCAQRSRANTATVVGNIAQAQVTVAWIVNRCALDNPTSIQFTDCVDRDLKAVAAGKLKPPTLTP